MSHARVLPWCLALLMGCGQAPTATSPLATEAVEIEKPAPPRALTPPAKPAATAEVNKLVHGNTAFAFDLYAALKNEPQLFISPYSISTALAMLYGGARAATADEIAKACRFPGPPDDLGNVYASLMWKQQGDRKTGTTYEKVVDGKVVRYTPAYHWHEANAVWAQRGAAFRSAYLDGLKRDFAAELRQADFTEPAAPMAIKQWMLQQTYGKVSIDLQPSKDTSLILVNAVYFKADWLQPFMPRATYDEEFKLEGKQAVKTPMMHLPQSRHPYMSHAAFEMLELGYEGGASLLVLLPKKVGLSELDPLLTAENFEAWRKKMHSQMARVTLPKFELRQKLTLNQALQALGIKEAFSPAADFSGIAPEPLFVDKVLHAAYVKMDEQGTEAAAVTAVEEKKSEPPPDPDRPIDFRVDRPFVFVIRDNVTGSVLFLGRVVDPRGK